jgi:sugar lactone lactonase YvrE
MFTQGINTAGTYAITAGSDGNLWFTEFGSGGPTGKIGRITPSGVVTEFAAPLAAGALGITAGPDGNLWYARSDGVGRITTSGVVTDFSSPYEGAARITVGPDGDLWFTTFSGHIGRITTNGAITIFSTGITSPAEPVGIIAGPDGAMWFTEYASNRIGRITTAGVVTEFTVGISAHAGPQEIAVGPDGNLWFTEAQLPGVARLTISVSGTRSVLRINGPDRFATAVAISNSQYPQPQSAQGVVLASSNDFPDALAGIPLAAQLKAPLLLTSSAKLDATTEAEVKRVLPAGATVTLLGGPNAIATSVVTTLQLDGYVVQRYAGRDRYATAAAIAAAIGAPTAVLLADGLGFADGLSAGAAAVHTGAVVLLTDGTTVPPATAAYLTAHSGLPVYAVGGHAASAAPASIPLVGADRYATSVQVAKRFFTTPATAGMADGLAFPDALAGDVENGQIGAPMLLVAPTGLPASVQAYLAGTPSVVALNVYGGTSAVPDAVINAAASSR